MCGLVGVVVNTGSGFFSTDADIFAQLLYIDVFRGDDATGVALVHNNSTVEILKEAQSSDIFLRDKEARYLIQTASKTTGKALLGHNRKSTIGTTNDKNAHPFVLEDRYVFFHNGTLKNHHKLHSTEVDSEALGLHLTPCEGDPKKLEEALEKVDGAYACVWYDQDKHKIYFLRNKDRPLTLAEFEGDFGFAYASEAWMLSGICARNNQKIKAISPLEEDTLYTIDLNTKPLLLTKEKLEVKKSNPPTTVSHWGGMGAKKVTGTDYIKSISKKYALKFMDKCLTPQTRVEFVVDDYIETEITGATRPKWIPRDWLVWGSSPSFEGVLFRGVIRQKTETELIQMTDNDMFGSVISSHYNEKDKHIVATLEKITGVLIESPFFN